MIDIFIYITDLFYIPFSLCLQNPVYVLHSQKSQFKPTTFQVLNSHMRLVAMIGQSKYR